MSGNELTVGTPGGGWGKPGRVGGPAGSSSLQVSCRSHSPVPRHIAVVSLKYLNTSNRYSKTFITNATLMLKGSGSRKCNDLSQTSVDKVSRR